MERVTFFALDGTNNGFSQTIWPQRKSSQTFGKGIDPKALQTDSGILLVIATFVFSLCPLLTGAYTFSKLLGEAISARKILHKTLRKAGIMAGGSASHLLE